MKPWSLIGLLFGVVILATIPMSLQMTPRGLELSVKQAQAITYGRARRVSRRVYRRSFPGPVYVGAVGAGYYGAGYYGGGWPGYGGYYSRQPVGGGGGQFYCSGYDPRCW